MSKVNLLTKVAKSAAPHPRCPLCRLQGAPVFHSVRSRAMVKWYILVMTEYIKVDLRACLENSTNTNGDRTNNIWVEPTDKYVNIEHGLNLATLDVNRCGIPS